jgi:hypothetical protein
MIAVWSDLSVCRTELDWCIRNVIGREHLRVTAKFYGRRSDLPRAFLLKDGLVLSN